MISDGILVTLGKAQISEKKEGWKTYVQYFKMCDGERAVYFWRLSKKPKREFTHVYIVVGNRVRYKARFIGYEQNRTIDFLDGSACFGEVWLQLIDFEKLKRPFDVVRGFQGFRYKD